MEKWLISRYCEKLSGFIFLLVSSFVHPEEVVIIVVKLVMAAFSYCVGSFSTKFNNKEA